MEWADEARTALMEQIALGMRETARWTGRAALSPRVAAALAKVRREAFVAPGSERAAYENRPLPIGHGQTISQPFVVALMTELLDLQPDDIVLEVGTGSGYQAAVLAELAGKVCSIEVIPELAASAAKALGDTGLRQRRIAHRRRRPRLAGARAIRRDHGHGRGPERPARAGRTASPRGAHGHTGWAAVMAIRNCC